MVETKPRSESASLTQVILTDKIAALQGGDWLKDYVSSDIPLAEDPNSSAAQVIEQRITSGARAIFADANDILSPSITRYLVEQEFEGVVLSVDTTARTLYVRLIDETNPDAPDEEALMSFDEISPDDVDLVVPGALFSWVMGRTERNGTVARHSEIRFRRMFRFSKQAIEHAENAAKELYSLLDEV